MSSEIRVNKINSRSGVSTVSFTDSGPIISGVTTFNDRVNIESNGLNVTGGSIGIGTDSPQAKLHLSSGGPGLQWTDTDNNSDSRIRYNGSLFIFEADRNDEVEDSTFSFRVDGANIAQEKVRISSGIGSVGIRSDTPKTPVDINCYNSDNDAYRGTVKINRYGHILQQNNTVVNNTGVSSYWSLAPRDNGDFDISFDEIDALNTFNAAGFDVLRLRDNGNVSVPNGNLIMAAGQGIDFSANDSDYGTPGSEILDDYEEGNITTWRLVKSGASTAGSNNVVTHVRYTKIGRCVYISGHIRTDSTQASQDGNLLLVTVADATVAATLPFTPNHSGGIPIIHTRSIDEIDHTMSLAFVKDSATIYVYANDATGDYIADTNTLSTNTQTNLVITFNGHFFTDS